MLADADGRMGLNHQRLGDSRETVMANAKNQITVPPLCMSSRMAIKGSRKAFMQETCTFKPVSGSMSFENLPIETISYRFVDGMLVRLDIEILASGIAAENAVNIIESHLSDQFGKTSNDIRGGHGDTPGTNQPADSDGYLAVRWFQGDDELTLFSGPLTTVESESAPENDDMLQSQQARQLSVRFLDAALAARAPALID